MRITGLILATTAALMSGPAAAQDRDAKVLPWVGCWEAADGMTVAGRTCVVPAGERALRVVNIPATGDATQSDLWIDGEQVPVKAEGCEGWERATLSRDGTRLIVDADISCKDMPRQRRQTAWVIVPSGLWLQVNGAGVSMVANAQVRVFRPVESSEGIPAETWRQVVPYLAEVEQAREAARHASVSAADLVELDEMQVAAPVVDIVVAAAYPQSFVIDGTQGLDPSPVQGRAADPSVRRFDDPYRSSNGFPTLGYYDWSVLGSCMRYAGIYSCPLAAGGYGPYPFGWPYGYGYGTYGYGGYGGIPVVVRPTNPDNTSNGGGRAVRGRGYTQTTDSDRGTAMPRNDGGSATRAGGYGSSSSTSGSSGGSGGGSVGGGAASGGASSGSSGRVAKPRDP